jgi:hypothetical protein
LRFTDVSEGRVVCILRLEDYDVFFAYFLVVRLVKTKIMAIISSGTSLNSFKAVPENDILLRRRSDDLNF